MTRTIGTKEHFETDNSEARRPSLAPDFDLWVPLPPGSSAGFEANLLGHFDALLDRFEAGNDLGHISTPLDRGEVAALLWHLLDQLK